MVALSHVEGTDVTYVYHGLLKPDPQVIEREVQALKDQRVDVLLTLGTQPALAAKKVTAGTAISVVFAPSSIQSGRAWCRTSRTPVAT
jgi:hypothetical protein